MQVQAAASVPARTRHRGSAASVRRAPSAPEDGVTARADSRDRFIPMPQAKASSDR